MAVAAISFVVAALATAFVNWLALIPWRRAADGMHWTEKAALLFPARVSAATNFWLVAISTALGAHLVFPEAKPACYVGGSLFGALAGTYPADRAVYPDFSPGSWLHIVASRWIIDTLNWLVLFGFALAMPHSLSARAWALVAAFIAVDAGLKLWLRLQLMKWLRLLRPPTERVSRIVGEVSARMGIPVRATWIIPSPQSNAVAFTVTRELGFTRKLMETLSDEEVAAICAHELGHLTESRWVAAGRILTALWSFALLLAVPVWFEFDAAGISVLVGVLWVARVSLRKEFRRMEKRADRVAAGVGDPSVYARALEKIYRANQAPAVMPGKRRIHPDLYDRMTASGITPDYPRPRAPKARSWTTYAMGFVTVIMLVLANAP